jgi:hypothetical protein
MAAQRNGMAVPLLVNRRKEVEAKSNKEQNGAALGGRKRAITGGPAAAEVL